MSLFLTAFVDLETLNWIRLETSRPDPEDEAKAQAHKVLQRKPWWKLSLLEPHATFFFAGRCAQMEGQRTRKGKKDCTRACCRATLCNIAFSFAKTHFHRIRRRDDDDDWQLSSKNAELPAKPTVLKCDSFHGLYHCVGLRRSLPWQTVFCFHAWLDFVRFGIKSLHKESLVWI